MLDETQKFYDYVTQGLKVKQVQDASAKCFFKLSTNTRGFMHPFTENIISNVLPDNLEDWKSNECNNSIIGSLGLLICSQADINPDKSLSNL